MSVAHPVAVAGLELASVELGRTRTQQNLPERNGVKLALTPG